MDPVLDDLRENIEEAVEQQIDYVLKLGDDELHRQINQAIEPLHNEVQQPPEQAPVHGSEAQASAADQTPARRHPTRKSGAQSPQGATGGEAQSADEGLAQALEQQITQAI